MSKRTREQQIEDEDTEGSFGRRPRQRRRPRRSDGPRSDRMPQRGRGRARTHHCPEEGFSYRDPDNLRHYLNETGKIKPRRQTGNCARCQRQLAQAVKRARHLALLPFVASGE